MTVDDVVTFDDSCSDGVLPLAIHSLLFYAFSQVSHINKESMSVDGLSWSKRQVRASRGDYSPSSRFLWPLISTGLNMQSIHHLFPTIHWFWYPFIANHVFEAVDETPIDSSKTFMDSLWNHMEWIRDIN